MKFGFDSRVRYSETGPDKRLTLVALVDYFQDCSTFQSEDVGAGMDWLQGQHQAWMILAWQIEILRLPRLAERIQVQTWAYEFKAFYGSRNYAMLDGEGNYLAKANSVWVLMDTEQERPVRVDPAHAGLYGLEEKLDMEYGSRKLAVPKECVEMEPFAVCRHHLDTNYHVNNGQYIRMAEEYLPAGFETRRLLVEYRKQARLHDVIVPAVHTGSEAVTVSLNDGAGSPYAILVMRR